MEGDQEEPMPNGATLKDALRSDLTTAMRARDEPRTATLRMLLTAISGAETAGKAHVELSDEQVVGVLRAEAKKRTEAAEIYAGAGRAELEAKERAELAVIEGYLPPALSEEDLARAVAEAIAETGASGPKGLGQVIKAVQAKVGGAADGRQISAAARAALGG
jgi:uncharacterized protein YqeY